MISNLKRNPGVKKPRFPIIIIISKLSLYLMIQLASPSFAEDMTLSLSSTQGQPNETVGVSLTLEYPGSPSSSGFNLDIYYDDEVLENPTATAGQVLINAEKDMSTSEPDHPYFGIFRIIVVGANTNTIDAGEVATIDFDIKSDAPGGVTDLILFDLAATDTTGDPLDALGSDGSIDVVDTDEDGKPDSVDNCPNDYNPSQEDTMPPDSNGCGDLCECEGDFEPDGDVDGTDAVAFKLDFFRKDCAEPTPCNGDFECDGDVDGTDAVKFKLDFFRKDCPSCTFDCF